MTLARRLLMAGGSGGSFAPPSLHNLDMLFNGQNGSGEYHIGSATSTDGGVTWTQYGSNPVMSKTGAGWESAHVHGPCLLWDGSQFVNYYSGYDGTKYQIGRATAPALTGPWTRYGGNPVIPVGAGGSIDDAGANVAVVLHEPADTGKEWKLWYGGNDGSTLRVCYAHSSDGLTFTKVGQVLDVGTAGAWDDVGIAPDAIVKSGSTYYLFLAGRQGVSNPQWQGGYATFTDPEGAYTKYAGNPTLLSRYHDSGASVQPTSDIASGATTVQCATAGFHVNEAIMLIDGAGAVQSEAHYIASIDSGSQLTLDSPTVGAFQALGGVLRSFAFNSSIFRSVLSSGSSWVAFGTPFQPVDDLTVHGESLWEGTQRLTASSLGGTWAYDYTPTGLLIPLWPTNTGWNQYSAENPSVIGAP